MNYDYVALGDYHTFGQIKRPTDQIRVGYSEPTFLIPRVTIIGCAWCARWPLKWNLSSITFLAYCPLCGFPSRFPTIGEHGSPRWHDSRPDDSTRHAWCELTADEEARYEAFVLPNGDSLTEYIECCFCHRDIAMIIRSEERPVTYRCNQCQKALRKWWRHQYREHMRDTRDYGKVRRQMLEHRALTTNPRFL